MDPVEFMKKEHPEWFVDPTPLPTPDVDFVKSPDHYTQFAIEPLDFIMANSLSFPQGNVIKYVCRYKRKGGLLDLKKARQYIDVMIEEEEANEG